MGSLRMESQNDQRRKMFVKAERIGNSSELHPVYIA